MDTFLDTSVLKQLKLFRNNRLLSEVCFDMADIVVQEYYDDNCDITSRPSDTNAPDNQRFHSQRLCYLCNTSYELICYLFI